MSATTVSATYNGRHPLSVLGDLVEKRKKWLKESAKDAVIATTIDTLVSLRGATRVARAKPKRSEVAVSVASDLRPSIYRDGGARKPCVRNASGQRVGVRRLKWFGGGAKISQLKVFLVAPAHERIRPYYVVAPSAAKAADFEIKHAAPRRIARYRKLARWAFGVAMNKMSTRNVDENGMAAPARNAGSKLSIVRSYGDDRRWTVEYSNSIDYSVEALKGGAASVEVSLKKAANKIAGRLIHRFKDALGPDFKTPFPEVLKRRRS